MTHLSLHDAISLYLGLQCVIEEDIVSLLSNNDETQQTSLVSSYDSLLTYVFSHAESYEVIVALIENNWVDVNYVTGFNIHNEDWGLNMLMILLMHSEPLQQKTIRMCEFLIRSGINLYYTSPDKVLGTYEDIIISRMNSILMKDPEETNENTKTEMNICLDLWEMIVHYRGYGFPREEFESKVKEAFRKMRNELLQKQKKQKKQKT